MRQLLVIFYRAFPKSREIYECKNLDNFDNLDKYIFYWDSEWVSINFDTVLNVADFGASRRRGNSLSHKSHTTCTKCHRLWFHLKFPPFFFLSKFWSFFEQTLPCLFWNSSSKVTCTIFAPSTLTSAMKLGILSVIHAAVYLKNRHARSHRSFVCSHYIHSLTHSLPNW